MNRHYRRHVIGALLLSTAFAVCASSHAAEAPVDRQAHRQLFARLEASDAVREGATAPKSVLYVLFDANCYYCHLTWKALQPYETAGLQVRWVPVAYQQPSSVGRAAAIMQASDRVAALRQNETSYDASTFSGAIAPIRQVPAAVVAQLDANTRLMQQAGAPGTPVLVWKDRSGVVHVEVGVPRLSELPRITGLPARPNADPELATFR